MEGGEEIVKSLSILFNKIQREQRKLTIWRQTTIKIDVKVVIRPT